MNNVITPVYVDGWLKDFEVHDSTKEEERLISLKADPLELACLLKIRVPTYGDIEDSRLVDEITPEIRAHAESVRKYYAKRWFWTALNNRSLSPFRQRAQYLLESRTCQIKKKDIGIYIKLPWFYEEDIVYEDLKKELITTDLPNLRLGRDKSLRRLEFVRETFGWQGKRRMKRYWFKDENNYLYGLEVETGNPLLPMFDDMIAERQTCLFETHLSHDRIDKLHYYKLHSYKLLKENNA